MVPVTTNQLYHFPNLGILLAKNWNSSTMARSAFFPTFLGALGHIKGMGLKRYLSSSKICLSGGRGPWARFFFFLWDKLGTWSNQFYPREKKRTSISASITMGWSKVEMTNQHSEGAPLALTICLELHLSQNKCSTWNLLALVKGVRAKVEQKIWKRALVSICLWDCAKGSAVGMLLL